MQTRPLEKADYDAIVRVIDDWWEGPSTALAHPIFFYELGHLGRVAEWSDGLMVGFLLGFVADAFYPSNEEKNRVGFIHLVGIHPQFRRRGVARTMYDAFEAASRDANCQRIKALTTQGDEGSVAFHRSIGYSVETVPDYAGPGRSRIVFEKRLT